MTRFNETDEGRAFIATGDSRETSPEIMEAIAFFARNTAEAEALLNGDDLGEIANPSDIWEHVTNNGLRDASNYVWGEAGADWSVEIGLSPQSRLLSFFSNTEGDATMRKSPKVKTWQTEKGAEKAASRLREKFPEDTFTVKKFPGPWSMWTIPSDYYQIVVAKADGRTAYVETH